MLPFLLGTMIVTGILATAFPLLLQSEVTNAKMAKTGHMVLCFFVCVHTGSIPSNLFLDPAVWKSISSRMANRYTRIFDAGGKQGFLYVFVFFHYIWPLAGPNIAEKGWPLQKLARGDRQTHFGTFNVCIKPGFL